MLDSYHYSSKDHTVEHAHGGAGTYSHTGAATHPHMDAATHSHLYGATHGHVTGNAHPHTGVGSTEHNIEKILKHNPHDFSHVYKELDQLRKHDAKHFSADLKSINHDLQKSGLLPHLQIVEDNRYGRHHKAEHGYSVVSDDAQLRGQPGNHTMVSTSHHAPHESKELQNAYHGMRYGHGHYNGWNNSVEAGGGAHGGYDGRSVGGHVPEGARKELVDKALQLAGLPATSEYEAAVNKIVTRESGWNPNITNTWDSNARKGTPSTGLMQTIEPTFQRYALPGYNSNIHDPLSNLVAGIRYAESRYHNRGGLLYVASRNSGY
jgi:hypothetical protein